MILISTHQDVVSIPWPHSVGRGSSVAMRCGVVYVADVVQILHCYGCGVGQHLQL